MAVALDQGAVRSQRVKTRRPHGFDSPSQFRFLLCRIRPVWVPHVESVEFDVVGVDVIGLRPALLDEAAERTQRVFAQGQWVKGQRVRLFLLAGPRDDVGWVVSGPVGQLEGERITDVLDDAAVR